MKIVGNRIDNKYLTINYSDNVMANERTTIRNIIKLVNLYEQNDNISSECSDFMKYARYINAY